MSASPAQALGKGIAARYPKSVALKDGGKVELRLMGADAIEGVLAFSQGLPADDLLFLRTNITERPVVEAWVDNIAAGRTFTVLALEAGRVAGYASVHLNQASWMRHLGEIRLLSGSSFRGRGLGRVLASEIYAVARLLGLRKLSAQMTADQAGARATFERPSSASDSKPRRCSRTSSWLRTAARATFL